MKKDQEKISVGGGAPENDRRKERRRRRRASGVRTRQERGEPKVAGERIRGRRRKMEQSYIMIKPDGVQRGLVGEIINRFSRKGFTLRGLKMMQVSEQLAKDHYADLSSKPFFGSLVDYIISAPVVAMVWEGKDVVKTGRKIIGATNPAESAPGTIRGDFCIEVGVRTTHSARGWRCPSPGALCF